jgi:beta-glucosidase
MSLPQCQNEMIRAIAAVQPNVIVVLHNGSPVEMPWIDQVPAVLESYLAGEAVGEAQADLLFGLANPCGKLAETFPLRVQDNPAYLDFGGNKDTVEYGEGIFVGYRYYDTKQMKVLFPFGHGLSYTEYEYRDLHLSADRLQDDEPLSVRFTVKNTGRMMGKEVAQLYLHKKGSAVSRADKELKNFESVSLEPGECKHVELILDKHAFCYYDSESSQWVVEPGEYEILVGSSSRDIRLSAHLTRTDAGNPYWRCNHNSTLGDILMNPVAAPIFRKIMAENIGSSLFGDPEKVDKLGEGTSKMMQSIINDSPLRALRSFYLGKVDDAFIEKIVDGINLALDDSIR